MAKFVIYKDRLGEYRWRLKSAKGQIIADSGEGYTSKQSAFDGIAFVKKYAPGASVEDQTVAVRSILGDLIRR